VDLSGGRKEGPHREEREIKRYHGDRTIDGIAVTVDGARLPTHAEKLERSARGFEWSYEGPEPAQLAFALLCDHLGDPAAAEALHRAFMRQVFANFDNEWEMTSGDVDAAIAILRGGTPT
jgi:hypothetical protein